MHYGWCEVIPHQEYRGQTKYCLYCGASRLQKSVLASVKKKSQALSKSSNVAIQWFNCTVRIHCVSSVSRHPKLTFLHSENTTLVSLRSESLQGVGGGWVEGQSLRGRFVVPLWGPKPFSGGRVLELSGLPLIGRASCRGGE